MSEQKTIVCAELRPPSPRPALSIQEQVVFFRDAARQVVAAYFGENPDELRKSVGYLVRCLENADPPAAGGAALASRVQS